MPQYKLLREVPVKVLAAILIVGSVIIGRTYDPVTLTVDGNTGYVRFPSKTVKLSGAVDRDLKFKTLYMAGNKVKGTCRNVKPNIPYLIRACHAQDGTYWAIQRWERLKRNFGGTTAIPEVHVSHWTAGPGLIEAQIDCGPPVRIRGTFTFHGKGVFGFKRTPHGVPLDPYGRNIYLGTLVNGRWQRENSFLTHPPDGSFVYAFWNPARLGTKLRLTAIGPGVSPVVQTVVPVDC